MKFHRIFTGFIINVEQTSYVYFRNAEMETNSTEITSATDSVGAG